MLFSLSSFYEKFAWLFFLRQLREEGNYLSWLWLPSFLAVGLSVVILISQTVPGNLSPSQTLNLYSISIFYAGVTLSVFVLPLFISEGLKLYKKHPLAVFHPRMRVTIPWILGAISMVWVLEYAALLVGQLAGDNAKQLGDVVMHLSLVQLYFMAIFIALSSYRIFTQTFWLESSEDEPVSYRDRYIKQENVQKLQVYIDTQRPYLNPNQSLERFAKEVDLSPKAVSTILNDVYHQTYSEFMTARRIIEVKALLADEGHLGESVFDLAKRAGFSSRSRFYENFKLSENMTPAEYRKSLKRKKIEPVERNAFPSPERL